MSLILDGKALSKTIEEELTVRVAKIKEKTGRTPILATILVGSDPSSAIYVDMKGKACARVGMGSKKVEMADTTTTEELLAVISELNANPDVHGILLQHPVPHQIDERRCFDAIAIEKDVDGVTCLGFGNMTMGLAAYGSATPQGIMETIKRFNIELSGKHAVVVGRSPILGKPMASMMLNNHATVTICHSRTKDLESFVRQADVVVGAVGVKELIKSDWIKDGAVVIDAGYHKGGFGDIEINDDLKNRCSAYTPVPGGVGPMTIATLMMQTVMAAEKASA
jgi:methylenetetrahydrofolate dehydrogenase (NADP+) / methenyltetrahydrofolate cyclohydrolase